MNSAGGMGARWWSRGDGMGVVGGGLSFLDDTRQVVWGGLSGSWRSDRHGYRLVTTYTLWYHGNLTISGLGNRSTRYIQHTHPETHPHTPPSPTHPCGGTSLSYSPTGLVWIMAMAVKIRRVWGLKMIDFKKAHIMGEAHINSLNWLWLMSSMVDGVGEWTRVMTCFYMWLVAMWILCCKRDVWLRRKSVPGASFLSLQLSLSSHTQYRQLPPGKLLVKSLIDAVSCLNESG